MENVVMGLERQFGRGKGGKPPFEQGRRGRRVRDKEKREEEHSGFTGQRKKSTRPYAIRRKGKGEELWFGGGEKKKVNAHCHARSEKGPVRLKEERPRSGLLRKNVPHDSPLKGEEKNGLGGRRAGMFDGGKGKDLKKAFGKGGTAISCESKKKKDKFLLQLARSC